MNRTKLLVQGAMIAALYTVLTFVSFAFGLSSGVVQLRLSEALTVLPYFTPAAVPGLFVGCFLSNLLTGAPLWDVVLGSLATLLGALGAWVLRRRRWLVPVPTILSNAIILPFVLQWVYDAPEAYPFLLATVGAGEFLSAGVLGITLLLILEKRGKGIFKI